MSRKADSDGVSSARPIDAPVTPSIGMDRALRILLTPDEDHPLTIAAANWLGSNPFTGETRLSRLPGVRCSRTDGPDRRSAPLRFSRHAEGAVSRLPAKPEAQLLAAFDGFAAECAPFEIPEMTLGQLGPFFALVPAVDCPELQALPTRRCGASNLSAPLSAPDFSRRKPDSLTDLHRAICSPGVTPMYSRASSST